jgi:site-specific recombinase XerD
MVTAIVGAERTLGQAVDALLAQPRPTSTHRSYTRTLEHLARQLGRNRPLATATDEELAEAVCALWAERAPRTWNRHAATIRSWLGWCRKHGWPVGDLALRVDRRAEPEAETKAIGLPELERVWGRADVQLRERALWRLLYESAARAEEALGLAPGVIASDERGWRSPVTVPLALA